MTAEAPFSKDVAPPGFSERDFYLAEFRGRTLAIVLPQAKPEDLAPLDAVLARLASNRTRVLVLSKDPASLERVTALQVAGASDLGWPGRLWRELQRRSCVGILVSPDEPLASACRRIALRLRLAKVLWIDPAGPLVDVQGERISWLDLAAVGALLDAPLPGKGGAVLSDDRRLLLEEIRRMIEAGLPAVNLCSFDGIDADLFTFEGSGTFFARDRYLEVRHLALDELDAAHDLVRRGVAEGYLVEREPEQLDAVMSHAFGVFVEGRYLAGLGALLPSAPEAGRGRAGEICSLYTLTRFLGEGVGGHLVGFALQFAGESSLDYVFACTTSERVAAFFERQGFRRVDASEIPARKWENYPADRRSKLLCLRHDLG